MDPIKLFIKRPILTSMIILAVVVFGVFSWPKIGVDQLPNVDIPIITVTTVLPGADPETIEKDVTEPLEEVLNTVPGLQKLNSTNLENVSQIVVRLELERDIEVGAQDVRDRVQSALSNLPSDIRTPVVNKLDLGALPIVTLSLSGPLSQERLTSLADDVVKPSLQQISGVGVVNLFGDREREVRVTLDPLRLRAFGLTPLDAVAAMRAQDLDMAGGRTVEPGMERTVKLRAESHSVEELRGVVLASPGGVPVRLADVADVTVGPVEARGMARLGHTPAVGMTIQKQSGANTVQVADAINGNLAQIRSQLPQGCELEVVNDGARFIRSSIGAVEEDMLLGGLLAVVVVLVFLRNWRSTIVAAVALPTSVVGTFAVMRALGFTFNIVTMLALTLSIGLLIDDAIVVIENIVRRLEQGMSPMEAAAVGTKQIAIAVLAVTMSIVAVFLPVAFMEGIVGRMFYQFGVTVAAAILISYGVSMILTPMMSSRLLREGGVLDRPVWRLVERALGATERGYRRVLDVLLRNRAWTLVAAAALMVLTVLVARKLEFSFMPAQDMSSVKVSLELPSGSRLEETGRQVTDLVEQIERVPGVRSVFSTAGGGVREEVHKGEILVNLVPIQERSYSQKQLKEHLRAMLKAVPGTRLAITDASSASGGGSRPQEIQFSLRSADWNSLLAAAEKTRDMMSSDPRFVDVDMSYRTGKPQVDVVVDRDRAASLGIAAAPLGQNLRVLLGRDKVADFRDDAGTSEIHVVLPDAVLADPAALGAVQVRSPSGALVELRSVAELKAGEGPVQIDRESQVRQITLYADLHGASLSEGMRTLEEFAAANLPASVKTGFEGGAGEMAATLRSFALAILLGVILLYIILAAQFESLTHPLSIMMSLPLSVIGAIGALLLAHQDMSIFAMIGMIMLMGLVTKNGILLVEFTNQLREQGRGVREALLEAGPVRLRPILMTTVAMIAGMIPVALARGDGAETRVPMAVAIIGGLVTSTFLTLGVVPVVYSVLDGAGQWLKRFRPVRRTQIVSGGEAEAAAQ